MILGSSFFPHIFPHIAPVFVVHLYNISVELNLFP